MLLRALVLLFAGLLGAGCHEPPPPFLALGHPYYWDDARDRTDPRLEALDLTPYAGVWLLGDLARKSSERETTLDTLDLQFQFRDPRVHWALGNHDLYKGDSARIVARTGRPTFYYAPGVRPGWNLLVLNTPLFVSDDATPSDAHCDQLERQRGLVRRATQAQRPSETLVVLHHHALLPQERAGALPPLDRVWNVYHPDHRVDCAGGVFADTYLPHFDRAAARGTQVIFIGGDLGQRAKQFDHRDERGIRWLGTGINNSVGTFQPPPPYVTDFGPDHVLLVRPEPRTGAFTHRFVPLRELLTPPAKK